MIKSFLMRKCGAAAQRAEGYPPGADKPFAV